MDHGQERALVYSLAELEGIGVDIESVEEEIRSLGVGDRAEGATLDGRRWTVTRADAYGYKLHYDGERPGDREA